jgi:hypothetical protein
MRSPRPEPGSGLPAPYEDPWRRLGAALGDVIASIRLRLRELWRRNGEGSLPRPRFWPGSWASLFWPLLLAVLLAGLLVPAGMVLGRRQPAAVSGAAPAASASASPPTATNSPLTSAVTDGATSPAAEEPPSASVAAAAPPLPAAGAPPEVPDRPEPPIPPPVLVEADDQGGADDGGSAAGDPIAAALLQGLLGDGPRPAWAIGLEARAAEGLLRLCLDDGFAALPLPERQRLADRWLARSQELGYERLELVDGRHRPLARTARVGSGMILVDSSEPPR